MVSISAAQFARTVELARAALSGLESLVISARHELPVPVDRLVNMEHAIESARAELRQLEAWTRAPDALRMH